MSDGSCTDLGLCSVRTYQYPVRTNVHRVIKGGMFQVEFFFLEMGGSGWAGLAISTFGSDYVGEVVSRICECRFPGNMDWAAPLMLGLIYLRHRLQSNVL